MMPPDHRTREMLLDLLIEDFARMQHPVPAKSRKESLERHWEKISLRQRLENFDKADLALLCSQVREEK